MPHLSAAPREMIAALALGCVFCSPACGNGGEVIGYRKTSIEAGSSEWEEPPTFADPEPITELCVDDAKDQDPTLTGDLLEIFFFSERDGNADLWTSRRESVEDPWNPPTAVEELNTSELEQNPSVSRDGLRIWFYSRREPKGIWYSERATRSSSWETPVPISDPLFDADIIAPNLDDQELRVAVSTLDQELDTRDIEEAVRTSTSKPWSRLSPVEGLNGPKDESTPFLFDGDHVILMSSGRTGRGDLYWAWRKTLDSAVETPILLQELSDENALDSHPWLAPDASVIFFGSARSGSTDLYTARRN